MISLERYNDIIIWGASLSPQEMSFPGSHGNAIIKLFELLKKNHAEKKVSCIVDSNKTIHGKSKLGKKIYGPEEIIHHPNALVIINTISMQAVLKAFRKMNVKNDILIIPYYFYSGTEGNPYSIEVANADVRLHREQIKQLYNLDDLETNRYINLILYLRDKMEDDLYTPEFYAGTGFNVEYFSDTKLAPKGDVTFIDVGAYIGDTVQSIKSLYAFEPDKQNYDILQKYISESSQEYIVAMPYALGDRNKVISFDSNGGMSKISNDGSIEMEQRIFDDLSIDTIGDSMIKMDIEGSEMIALKGMQKFIREKQPYLAICIYHKEEDLYEIPRYLKSLVDDYTFYIRGGWHLECWAVPKRHFNS